MRELGVATPTIAPPPTEATDATRAAYDQYRQDFITRVANTPQYLQAQFRTTPADDYSDASPAVQAVTSPGGIGLQGLQDQIRSAVAANPNASNEQIRAAQQATGISNRDIYDATGNYWGNVLRAPAATLRPAVPGEQGRTPQALADYYGLARTAGMPESEMVSHLRGRGVTDTQMNEARNLLLGVPAGSSWAQANQLVGQTQATPAAPSAPNVVPTGGVLDMSPQGLANYYRQLSTQGMTEEQIIQQARARGATDQQMMEARNVLLGRPAGTAWSGASATIPSNSMYDEPPSGYAHGGGVHALARKYANGGTVRKFARGGRDGEEKQEFDTELSMGSDVPALVMPRGVEPAMLATAMPAPAMPAPMAPAITASPAAQPVVPPAPPTTPVSPPAMDLMSMVQRYMGQESSYGPELRAARERAAAESANFEQMLRQMATSEREPPDKAELYFRLAAAFGAPTRTGTIGETLGAVGKELAAHQQETRTTRRADEQMRRQLAMEIAKSRMGAAREDVASLRGLAGEEMKDRRALLMEYLRSGRPQSDAGKAALDKGLKQGTPEFAQFVDKYIDDKIRTGNLFKEAMVAISQGNLQVAQAGLGIKQEESARKAAESQKLSPPELKLRSETEDALRTADSALRDLNKALELNPNTFDTTIMDATRRTLLEQTGSKDPKLANTREQENLMQSGVISTAADKMKGVLSDNDMKLLQSVAGLNAKSIEVRKRILENAIKSVEAAKQAQKKRLDDIVAGRYRMTTPSDGEQ